ncbi:hypothetical protein Gpo141_00011966 [Globisporangium polare]
MAKLLFYAAAALCALAGASQAQNATTTAPPVVATKPPCVPLNFTLKAADFKSLNSLITFAISNGLLSSMIPETIADLQLTGVSAILPKTINATSADTLAVAADFNGTVSLKAKFSISIQQLDLKWYSICWTDAIHTPFTCPPAKFDVEVDLVMVKPGVVAAGKFDLSGCTPGTPRTVCKDVSASDVTLALLNQAFPPLLKRLLTRLNHAEILDFQVGWQSITTLDFNITNKSAFINYLLDALVDFSVKEVNKMGDIYNTVTGVVDSVLKSALNQFITSSLAPKFGNYCYDA